MTAVRLRPTVSSSRGAGYVLEPVDDSQAGSAGPLQVAPTPRLPPRHPAWLVGGPLPSSPGGRSGEPLPDDAWGLLRGAPRGGAVLTSAPLTARLAGWSLAGVAARFGASAAGRTTILAGRPGGPPEVLPLNPAANVCGAPYRVRRPSASFVPPPPGEEGDGGGWRLGAAAAAALGWAATPLLLQATLLAGGRVGSGGGSPTDDDPAAALAAGVDWAWAAGVSAAAGWGPPLSAALLASGPAGAVCPAAWDPTHPRLVACLGGGTVRLLTAPPGDALARAYPFPLHHPHAGASAVRWADPDLAAWPAFAGLRCGACTLRPGDVAVLPPAAMAHAELVPGGGPGRDGDGCALLVLTLAPAPVPPARPPAWAPPPPDPGAAAVRAVLGAEATLAGVVGPERVRAWLRAVGRGAAPPTDSVAAAAGAGLPHPLDLGSVRGAALAAALAAVASDLAVASGGSGAGARALAATATARRLVPTHWLDDGGPPDPLLLADTAAGWPLRFAAPALTPEEAAYPQLFRRAVAAKSELGARGPPLLPPARQRKGGGGGNVEGAAALPALPAPPPQES